MLKTTLYSIYKAGYHTVHNDGIEHAGYLAFLGLLALFPFLVLLVSVVGLIGQGESGAVFISSILQNLPGNITIALKPRIEEILSGPPQGLVTISIIGALWTSSSAVEGLRTVLNKAYRVDTPPTYLFRRMLSIFQVMFFAMILIGVMFTQVFIPLIFHHLADIMGFAWLLEYQDSWWNLSMFVIPLTLFVVVSFLYFLLPNIKQKLISVLPGAAVATAMLIGITYILTLYLSKFSQINLIYGSLGGIIAALVFAYICNVIFIFGAELNYQIVKLIGMRIVEKEQVDPEPTTLKEE